MTDIAPTPITTAGRPLPRAAGATFWAASRETGRRSALQYLRTPQMLFSATAIARFTRKR